MKYSLAISLAALKYMAKMPKFDAQMVKNKILKLPDEPRPRWCLKLKGRDAYRIPVGNFRVIYQIDDSKNSIVIIDVDNRKDVYQ
jgi:mRNA interferase RelE/StbE